MCVCVLPSLRNAFIYICSNNIFPLGGSKLLHSSCRHKHGQKSGKHDHDFIIHTSNLKGLEIIFYDFFKTFFKRILSIFTRQTELTSGKKRPSSLVTVCPPCVCPDASMRQLTLTLLPHSEIRLKVVGCPDLKVLQVLNLVRLF